METLPDALCAALLAPLLPLRDRVYALARVSRRWRRLAWRSVRGGRALDLTWCTGEHELQWVVATLVGEAAAVDAVPSKLESFQLYGPRVDARVLTRLFAGVGYAQVKRIEIESKQSDDAALLRLGGCTALTHLTLHCVKLTSDALATISCACPQLEMLDLAGCSRVCDEGVVAVAANCSRLSGLNLFMCHRITDRAMVAIALRKHKTLTSLAVDRCLKVSGLALRFLLKSQPKLRALSFANCPKVQNHDFVALHRQLSACSPLLESIEMSGCALLGDDGATSLVSRNAATLRTLSARALLTLSRTTYASIARCSQLTDLNLSMCRTLRNCDLAQIVSGCSSLQSLQLQGCVQIDDDGADAIARHGNKLQLLSLEFCYNFTDDGFAQIVRGCHALQDLNVKALNQLTIDAFHSLITLKSDVAPLRRINIGACADFETTLGYAATIKRRYPRARIEWT